MSAEGNDFTHNLAIKLSRALNLVNPNDLLAQRVTDIAKANSVDGFITGQLHCGLPYYHSEPSFSGESFWQIQGLLLG